MPLHQYPHFSRVPAVGCKMDSSKSEQAVVLLAEGDNAHASHARHQEQEQKESVDLDSYSAEQRWATYGQTDLQLLNTF